MEEYLNRRIQRKLGRPTAAGDYIILQEGEYVELDGVKTKVSESCLYLFYEGSGWILVTEEIQAGDTVTRFYINGRWVELKELVEKSEKWDRFITGLEAESERSSIIIEKYPCKDKLKAIKNYLNELEDTGRFIDKQKLINILEGK